MKRLIAAIALFALAAPLPAAAQTNDDDYTPLNSRIKRSRQFPADLLPKFIPPEKLGKVSRDWGQAMLTQYGKCLYRRSNEGSLALLAKTDFGFVDFKQVGLEQDKAFRIYGFRDCLAHVADMNSSGVLLRYSAASLRQWLIQAAYADRYPEGPTWVKPGNVIAPREFPLSANQPGVVALMDFVDCVMVADPYSSDFFYRTAPGSEEEKLAINNLAPSLGPCLPDGMQVALEPTTLRVWLGEALWHASTHSGPAPAESGQ